MHQADAPLQILLVDDRVENLIAYEAVLKPERYCLTQVRSGKGALEEVSKADFALVLLDIQMPEMDGFETAWRIRELSRGRDVPIVFVTALDRDPEYLERGYRLGTVDYVFKPIEPSALRARVKLFADLHRRQAQLRDSETRFRMMVQGVKDYAIFMLNPKGEVQTWNEGARRLKGYEASDIIGRHFSTFYEQRDLDSDKPGFELREAERTGRFEDEGWRVRKDGSRFWANVVISAIRDEHGNLMGFSKVTRDLTERKRNEEALREARDKLEVRVAERTAELSRKEAVVTQLLEREKEARRRLEESENQLRTFVDSIPQLAWMAGPDGTVFWYNKRWYEYTGATYEQMEVRGWQSVHDPAELPRVLDYWNRVVREGTPAEIEVPVRGANGEFRWFLASATPIRNARGEVTRWFGTNTDIHEARQARLALQEDAEVSQAFLNSMFENLPNMVFLKSAKDLRFVRFNRAGEELLGYSRDEMIGKDDYDFFPREQADFFTSRDRAVLAGDRVVDIPEEVIQTRCKGQRILHTRKIPLKGPDGAPAYLLGISEDITDWKRAEAERLKMIGEQAAIRERERAAQRTAFLAEASTLLSSSLDYRETLDRLARLSTGAVADWCTVTVVGEEGQRERVAIAHRDSAKTALIGELANFYPLETGGGTGIGHVIETGKSVLVESVPDSMLAEAAQSERHLMIMRELGCRSCIIVPITLREKTLGAIAFVSSRPERLYGESDLSLAEEIARRAAIAIENAILYETAQKAIRTRDEFLSIASHELKTPITSLKLQLQIARKRTKPAENISPPADKLASMLDVSTEQVNRLTALVDDLLDVSRIQAGKLSFSFENVDVAALVREMAERYGEHLRATGCEIRITAPEPVHVWGDRFRLEQVVLNLLSNAAKYGRSRPVELSAVARGNRAIVSCRDKGIGIAQENLSRVFERFERAIDSNNISGLGLGLYITREIVHAHQGEIRVESELGQGSCFIVELPTHGVSGLTRFAGAAEPARSVKPQADSGP